MLYNNSFRRGAAQALREGLDHKAWSGPIPLAAGPAARGALNQLLPGPKK